MATRAFIMSMAPDGTVRRIYCHFDGYPEGVGRTLHDHYKTPGAVSELLDLGDISSLEPSIEATVAYHRDRGEDYDSVRARTYPSVSDAQRAGGCEEFNYLFDERTARWTYTEDTETRVYDLARVLQSPNEDKEEG